MLVDRCEPWPGRSDNGARVLRPNARVTSRLVTAGSLVTEHSCRQSRDVRESNLLSTFNYAG